MFVIPKAGYSIPDPDMRDYLPPEGREVPESSFWHRCINDGDVTVGQPQRAAQPASKTQPKSEE